MVKAVPARGERLGQAGSGLCWARASGRISRHCWASKRPRIRLVWSRL